jgi:GntR family transcriptional regulator
MEIRISPGDGVPIYLQIVNQVKYLVASGRLQPDDRLPPVRKLAEQLVINPNTVARAYRELESAGVITARPGSGAFVTGNGSPLAKREQNKILNDRIDMLLTESRQMNVDFDTLVKLLRNRNKMLDTKSSE